MKGTYKKNNNPEKGLGWGELGAFGSYEESIKLALLHDDEDAPATAFKTKRPPRSMVLSEMLQEIT